MGMGRALLMRDLKEEEKAFQKKAKKKSLWGSIGRTLGGLGAMALTGGAVNPLTVGLISGGASFLGGAAGAKLSKTGDLSKQGKFFKSDRESIQKELGAFGTQNLMSSLRSGLTAGLMKKAEIMKAGGEEAFLKSKAADSLKMSRQSVGVDTGIGEGLDVPFRDEFSATPQLEGSDLWSSKQIWDRPSGISKLPETPTMESAWTMQGFKTKFQDYFAPGKNQTNAYLYERYPEMFEGSSMRPKNGMSTVIGDK